MTLLNSLNVCLSHITQEHYPFHFLIGAILVYFHFNIVQYVNSLSKEYRLLGFIFGIDVMTFSDWSDSSQEENLDNVGIEPEADDNAPNELTLEQLLEKEVRVVLERIDLGENHTGLSSS